MADVVDTLANAVRSAWSAHARAIESKEAPRVVQILFVAVLRAERALEADCASTAETDRQRAFYAANVASLDAQIDDELCDMNTAGALSALARVLEN